jgi:methyl-accepting chemotaxis protein
MLTSIFEDQPDFIRMFTVWKPNALDGMDARYIGRISSTGTGQFAFNLGRETGRISAYNPGSVVPAVMEHINGPDARKDSVDHPVPVTVLGKERYAVRLFVPIINKRTGEVTGAVGCQLGIDFIQPMVEAAIMEYEEVYALSVYSGNGFIMGHYNPERIGQMLIDSEAQFGEYISVANDAVNSGREFWCSGYDPLLSTTLQMVMVPVTIGNSDTTWSIMVGTAEGYILREVNAMTRFAITLLIMALIIAVVIINFALKAILT